MTWQPNGSHASFASGWSGALASLIVCIDTRHSLNETFRLRSGDRVSNIGE